MYFVSTNMLGRTWIDEIREYGSDQEVSFRSVSMDQIKRLDLDPRIWNRKRDKLVINSGVWIKTQ